MFEAVLFELHAKLAPGRHSFEQTLILYRKLGQSGGWALGTLSQDYGTCIDRSSTAPLIARFEQMVFAQMVANLCSGQRIIQSGQKTCMQER